MRPFKRIVNDVECTIIGFDSMSNNEIKHYIDFIQKEINKKPSSITIESSPNGMIDLSYEIKSEPFERIRRITGKPVG